MKMKKGRDGPWGIHRFRSTRIDVGTTLKAPPRRARTPKGQRNPNGTVAGEGGASRICKKGLPAGGNACRRWERGRKNQPRHSGGVRAAKTTGKTSSNVRGVGESRSLVDIPSQEHFADSEKRSRGLSSVGAVLGKEEEGVGGPVLRYITGQHEVGREYLPFS